MQITKDHAVDHDKGRIIAGFYRARLQLSTHAAETIEACLSLGNPIIHYGMDEETFFIIVSLYNRSGEAGSCSIHQTLIQSGWLSPARRRVTS